MNKYWMTAKPPKETKHIFRVNSLLDTKTDMCLDALTIQFFNIFFFFDNLFIAV